MPFKFLHLQSQLSAILREVLMEDSESPSEHASGRDFGAKTLCGAEADKENALGLSNVNTDVPGRLATALFHPSKYFASALWIYLAAFKARLDISEWSFMKPPASSKSISSIPEEVSVQ